MKQKYNLAFFLFLLISLGVLPCGNCAEDYLNLQVSTKILRGKITQIGRMKSEITVNGSDEQGKPLDMTFKISENTRVAKNGVLMSFTSVMQGYEVVVEYYDNPKAEKPYVAKRIDLVTEEKGGY
ncbi:MAG: hypothetical protein PHN59_03520 [Candidatus Omnitrophica bacterium]|nr:hypothetical protein [Candidatus Omnitrophota bacterium]